MQKLLLLGAGGAIGAVLRYAVSGLTHQFAPASFPWGTFVVNASGCFVIGCVWAMSEELSFSPSARLFVLTGVLGAFTTFSTFGLETFHLFRDGEAALALLNVLAHNVLGLLCVAAGFFLGRAVMHPGGMA